MGARHITQTTCVIGYRTGAFVAGNPARALAISVLYGALMHCEWSSKGEYFLIVRSPVRWVSSSLWEAAEAGVGFGDLRRRRRRLAVAPMPRALACTRGRQEQGPGSGDLAAPRRARTNPPKSERGQPAAHGSTAPAGAGFSAEPRTSA